MKTERLIVGVVILVLLAVLARGMFWHRTGSTERLHKTPIPVTKLNAVAIAMAYSEYFSLFGAYPDGNNSAISKALAGDNPKKIAILGFRHLGKNGEMLDPWGVPYEIHLTEDRRLQIRSAGSNRTMGDADDVLYTEPLVTVTNYPPATRSY